MVEDDEMERNSVAELLSHEDVEIGSAETGAAALARLRRARSIASSSI